MFVPNVAGGSGSALLQDQKLATWSCSIFRWAVAREYPGRTVHASGTTAAVAGHKAERSGLDGRR